MNWILDRLLPDHDFRTRYARQIAAPPDEVWTALHQITADDLPITRLLSRVRSGGKGSVSGPFLEHPPVPALAREEGKEMVNGAVAKFWRPRPVYGPVETREPEGFRAFTGPGWVKAAMSFQLTPTGSGTTLAIETRAKATDGAAKRLFAPYWVLIRIGGAGLIRLELLEATEKRAEAAVLG